MNNAASETSLQVGQRIKAARKARGLSQAELAKKAGLSLPLISQIENGKSKMLVPTLVAILEALEVSADSILQPETPSMAQQYQGEIHELLSDCTPAQIKAIAQIVRQVKATMAIE